LKLELIHKWACPYSARVCEFIEERGLQDRIAYLEVNETEGAKDRLAQLTGKTQVPCLVADGEPILESREIIQWLEQNAGGTQGVARA